MSDTTETVVRRLRESSPTVDAVCRQLARQVDPEETALVARFAEIFFSKASADFLHERSTDALARMVLGAYRFLERSSPEQVDVEVLNPDVDNEGWYAPVTVVRTSVSERPFVVDTIREYLHSEDLAIEHNIYPVLHVERDAEGKVVDVRPSREGEQRESLVHCEVARVTDPEALERIESEVAKRLQDVVRATDDFHPMLRRLQSVSKELANEAVNLPGRREELLEALAFVEWLEDDAFVFLGYRAYDLTEVAGIDDLCILVEPGSGLGILRNEAESTYAAPVSINDLDESIKPLVEGGPLLIISKTNAESTVHRRARMDYIGIKKLDAKGRVSGEHRFVGLFTSKAYLDQAERIPILRDKLQQILEDAGVQEGSHDFKEINTIFNSLPKEELFLASVEEIASDVRTVLTTYQTQDVRITLRTDQLSRGSSVMVILPKDRFSGEVRHRIEAALIEAFQGEVLNYHLAMGDGDQARLHFAIAAESDRIEAVAAEELERVVGEIIRSWTDRLRDGLERRRPPDEARKLARRYGQAFGPEYQAVSAPGSAVEDILELEAMHSDGRDLWITCANRGPDISQSEFGPVTELKIYLLARHLILSDFMPILENCGLRVIAVSPFEVMDAEHGVAMIYAFEVQDSKGDLIGVEERGSLLAQTILAVRRGDVTNDGLNQLVLTAGLQWREVEVLRAYASYAFQIGAVPSRNALLAALTAYPEMARLLFDIFRVRFDPRGPADPLDRTRLVREFRVAFKRGLNHVDLLADDRALRRLLLLVDSTARTNYFRNGGPAPAKRSGGVPYLSLKIEARQIREITRGSLLYEVWVRSSRMEGIHLRGAKVARGGIRWSDRPDDFRTEVLGLVKTQMVKNAVIVPAGSKGGFVTLRDAVEADERADEGREQYKTLVRGLLDITDNLDGEGNGIPPEGVVCYDAPDPYLVVAADKGTATFSDVANEVAHEYDFWLGDAFASGGSNGYDHKAVGITAGGAWECVKRHFHEKGKDIQAEPFTVVGIGDMGGDVFGNGMLLSPHIKLLAAFDHRHVFIDPNPDPAISFAERQRLFGLGRSSWTDYDETLLSTGGAIIPRGAKEVQLSPEAMAALGISEEELPEDGESLIRAVLCAPAELLWNGGIGTYVKASTESHSDAGDSNNDAVRVDATDLRCEVVGEGGNLGFTQRARIEYALAGGRLNTDALDNSGGVDLSDREVNLKILLNSAVRAGSLSTQQRNELLEDLTDPVAALVLEDNRVQSLAVSLDELRASRIADDFKDLMTALEKEGRLDRTAEELPSMEQLVDRQSETGVALTRPELCVLLSYSKLHVMSHLLSSELPDDPATEPYITQYFPRRASLQYPPALKTHRLRREIIASQVTNDVVGIMGATFVHRVCRDTGRSPAEVVRAWLVGANLAGHRSLMASMFGQADLQSGVAYRWLLGLGRVLDRTTRWVLAHLPPDTPMDEVIEANKGGLALLRSHFRELVVGEDRRLFEERVREIKGLGADEELADRLITLRFLDQLLEILRIAGVSDSDPVDTARTYYKVADTLQVPWLRQAVVEGAGDDRWEQRAAQLLTADLTRAHRRVVVQAMRSVGEGVDWKSATARLTSVAQPEVKRFRNLVEELRADGGAGISGLSVAVREMLAISEGWSSDP